MNAVRKSLKLTQVEFANSIEVTQSMIAHYEKDLRQPSRAVLKHLINEFGVNAEWLETEKGEMFINTQTETTQAATAAPKKTRGLGINHKARILGNEENARSIDEAIRSNIEPLISKILEESSTEYGKNYGEAQKPYLNRMLMDIESRQEYLIGTIELLIEELVSITHLKEDTLQKRKMIGLVSCGKQGPDHLLGQIPDRMFGTINQYLDPGKEKVEVNEK